MAKSRFSKVSLNLNFSKTTIYMLLAKIKQKRANCRTESIEFDKSMKTFSYYSIEIKKEYLMK